MAETKAEAEKRQWKAGGRPVEKNIIFMKQIDKEKIGRNLRETAEAVAETEAETEKRQWKAGGRSIEEMIIFIKQIYKETVGREFREATEHPRASLRLARGS